jgi:hypothetical protein
MRVMHHQSPRIAAKAAAQLYVSMAQRLNQGKLPALPPFQPPALPPSSLPPASNRKKKATTKTNNDSKEESSDLTKAIFVTGKINCF